MGLEQRRTHFQSRRHTTVAFFIELEASAALHF